MRRLLLLAMLAACSDGGAPQIDGLADQTATVGVELVLFIDATDPEGDRLIYGVDTDVMLQGHATLTQNAGGMGVFRWTPTAADIGANTFDFSASDDDHTTTVSIVIEVVSSAEVPIFRQPLGAGTVVTTQCAEFDIVVDDLDSVAVAITEVEPLISGATLLPIDEKSAHWKWCPTSEQIAASDRYTLILSADDGDTPPTVKHYVLVLAGSTGGARLVINEVDYDQAASDTREFIELVNPGSAPISLAGLALVLVNGSTGSVYGTVDLSMAGSLAGGRYLVVAGPTVAVDGAALHIDPVWTQDEVQNGPTDGVALIDTVTMTVIDALAYEGAITSVMIDGFGGPVSLVEGTALPATVADENAGTTSLCRSPNASDTNNASADWVVCATATPGRANSP